MKALNPMMLALLSATLIACGGGGGGSGSGGSKNDKDSSSNSSSTSPQTEEAVTSTRQLVASNEFQFSVDKVIALNIDGFPSDYGKVNVYSGYAYYDTTLNTHYPDYETLIASYIASTDLTYQITVTEQTDTLLLEWLPMDGLSNESYLLVQLNSNSTYNVNF